MNTIMVCIKRRFGQQPSCGARGGEALAKALEAEIETRGLPVKLHRFPCLGMCEEGPNMKIVGGDLFHHVCAADLPKILEAALDG